MSQKQTSLAAAHKYLQKGQYDKAIAAFQQALRYDPEDVRVRFKLGETQQKFGDARGAVESYRQTAAQHAANGFLLKAAAVYKRILALEPRNIDVHIQLAEVYQQLGLVSEAMSFFYGVARILQEHQDSVGYLDILRRMADLESGNVGIRIKLAEFYSGQGKMDEAIAEFTQACQMLYGSGRLDDYAKVAERLIYHRPEALEEIHRLVEVYLDNGDTRRALAKLQQAAKVDAQDPATMSLLVRTFEALGQRDKVVQVLREKARAHDTRGQQEEATQAWRQVLVYSPQDAEARSQLGMEAQQPAPVVPPPPVQNASEDAEEIERLLTETDVYIRYGLTDRAFDHLRKVFLMDPNNLDAMERIKEMHFQAGYYPQAVDELLRMAKLASMNDRARALDYLREAIQLIPDNEDTTELAQKLGFSQQELFPVFQQAAPGELAEMLPDVDSVDNMLAQLTAEFGDEAGAEGAAPLTHVQELDMPQAPPEAASEELAELDIDDLHSLEDPSLLSVGDDASILAELDIDDVELASQLRDSLDDLDEGELLDIDGDDVEVLTEDEGAEIEIDEIDAAEDAQLIQDLQDGFGLSADEVNDLSAILSGHPEIAIGSISMAPPSEPSQQPVHEVEEDAFEVEEDAFEDDEEELIPIADSLSLHDEPEAEDEDDLILMDDEDEEEAPLPPSQDPDQVLAAFFGGKPGAQEEVEAPEPPSSVLTPISQQTRQDLSQFASHFKHEAATAAYTPTSARGTVTEADMQTLAQRTTQVEEEEEAGATSMIDIHEMQRRMSSMDLGRPPVSLPGVPEPAPPAAAPAPAPVEIDEALAEELAEVDFFLKYDLKEDAAQILEELLQAWPAHPELLRRLGRPVPVAAVPSIPAPSPVSMHLPTGNPSLAEDSLASQSHMRSASLAAMQASYTEEPATPHEPAPAPVAAPMAPAPSMAELSVTPLPNFEGEDMSSHFELGLAYREMGLLEDAIGELRKAIEEERQVVESHLLIGQCYLDSGALHEALGSYKHALRAAAQSPEMQAQAYYRLALVYERLGQRAEAGYHYQRANQRPDLFPDLAQRLAAYG